MAIQRSEACCLLLALLLSLQLTGGLAGSAGDITVYWGRNKDEGSLREACDTGLYKTVIISFLSAFGHYNYTLDLSGHPPAGVGDDINYCKSKGIVVLLAIGGQGGEYSLTSSQAAYDVAGYLWNAFLGGSRGSVVRPFGNATLDGVDFFIDQGSMEHYNELAKYLFDYTKYYRVGRVVLTATTRCGYPDQRLEAALRTCMFDRIHVRMYGGDRKCLVSPVEWWQNWASVFPRSKVFVGLAASPDEDAAAYIPPSDLYSRLLYTAKIEPNYGGVMIWNRYYDKNTGYTKAINQLPE
ncbi:hypothetical protein EJB05_26772, partial [Eragrostis curvula]